MQLIARLERGIGSVPNLLTVMKDLELHLSGIGRGATLAEQMVNRRKRLGLSLEDVATKARISRTTLAALERGEGTVTPLLKVLGILGKEARPAKPVRTSWAYDRNTDRDKRFTPRWFLDHVVAAFGSIDLDPCGHELAAVEARRKIILPEDGLAASWANTRLAYVNPPFSNLVGWLVRAVDAYESGECQKVVMLVPTRTDSSTFHDRVVPCADIALIRGRMRFEAPEGLAYHAPFAMMAVILGGSYDEVSRFAELVPATWMMRDRSANLSGAQPALGEAQARQLEPAG